MALRVWVLRSSLGSLDSDEAVVGLMARRLAFHGDFTIFFWGQDYGGSLEAILVAAVFRVFGSSVLALKLMSLVLCISATALAAVLGTKLVGRRVGLYGAAAFWLATGNYVWFSTKARLFYWMTLNLGLLLLLLLLRLVRHPGDRRAWIAFGFVAGLGWWTSPQILYFAVPASAFALFRLRRALWRPLFLWAAPAAVVGALPWLYANLRSGFASLENPHSVEYSYAQHLKVFFKDGLPVLLGLHALGRWVVSTVFPVLYLVLLVVIPVVLVRQRRRLGVLALFVAAYPFVFALYPTSWVVGEGRYLLFLAPALWLVLASAVPPPRVLLPLGLAGVLAVTVADLRIIEGRSLPLAVDVLVPDDDSDLLELLDRHNVTRASADYWVAYRTTFETKERIIVAPDIEAQMFYPRYTTTVRASPHAARIFLVGTRREGEFRQALAGAEHCVRREQQGAYVLYLPDPAAAPDCATTAHVRLRP